MTVHVASDAREWQPRARFTIQVAVWTAFCANALPCLADALDRLGEVERATTVRSVAADVQAALGEAGLSRQARTTLAETLTAQLTAMRAARPSSPRPLYWSALALLRQLAGGAQLVAKTPRDFDRVAHLLEDQAICMMNLWTLEALMSPEEASERA